jgi:hypothetical protein
VILSTPNTSLVTTISDSLVETGETSFFVSSVSFIVFSISSVRLFTILFIFSSVATTFTTFSFSNKTKLGIETI